MSRLLALMTAGVLTAGCGGAPTAPEPVPDIPAPVQFRIVADPVIDMVNGETRALRLEDRDDAGAAIARPPTAHTWTTSDPDVVGVEPDGTLHARADFGGDVMSADWALRITKPSVGALMDLGYPAAWYGSY